MLDLAIVFVATLTGCGLATTLLLVLSCIAALANAASVLGNGVMGGGALTGVCGNALVVRW